MSNTFWRNKRILVTGYEGFLGSNLTKALISLGAKVIGLDIEVRRADTILTKCELKKIVIIKGSVTDFSLLKSILGKNKISTVFHLAAEAIVGKNYANPLKSFSTNIEGTWKVLEASRGLKNIQSIIVASSDKAYGNHKKLPYTENMPLIGKNTYDVSKSCADLIAYAYFYSYGLPVSVTRCGNIYGPGDFNFSRIFPDAARCALTGKTLYIRSNGKFTRDYVYVSDIVDGYLMLAEKMNRLKSEGEAFNFSDENPISVLDLVKKIYKVAGTKESFKVLNLAKYEIPHQYLSSRKSRAILHWKPRVSLDEGLIKTVSWYRELLLRK